MLRPIPVENALQPGSGLRPHAAAPKTFLHTNPRDKHSQFTPIHADYIRELHVHDALAMGLVGRRTKDIQILLTLFLA